MKVSIVVPALNEGPNLQYVLPRIPRLPEVCEVLLVDGGSTDDTVETVPQIMPDIRVVRQQGKGKGNAIRFAASIATGDYFLVLDADGSHRPEEIPAYIAKAREGYDLVKGNRYLPGGGTHDETGDRGLLVRLTDLASNVLWGARFQDMAYGMFLVDRQKFLGLGLQGQYFELEWEMLLKAHKRGLKIAYVPGFEDARLQGRSHLTYRRDGWRIFKVIVLGGLQERLTAPFRFFRRRFPRPHWPAP